MAKIIGNTTATPMAIPDWNQTDETKADYIKNKPHIMTAEEIEALVKDFELITIDDIDVICGGSLEVATLEENTLYIENAVATKNGGTLEVR